MWRTTRNSKFGAKACTIDGIKFRSLLEGRRYVELKALQVAGWIQSLKCHTRYEFFINGVRVGHYTDDFNYVVSQTGEVVVEDTKARPTATESYVIRRNLMLACHQIVITEVFEAGGRR